MLNPGTIRQLGKYYDTLQVLSSNEGLKLQPKQWIKKNSGMISTRYCAQMALDGSQMERIAAGQNQANVRIDSYD